MQASIILAALALTAAASPPIDSQAVSQTAPAAEQTGKCSGPDGKDAASVLCKGAGPAPGAGGASTSSAYKLDKKGVCRDAKGKMVKAELCKL